MSSRSSKQSIRSKFIFVCPWDTYATLRFGITSFVHSLPSGLLEKAASVRLKFSFVFSGGAFAALLAISGNFYFFCRFFVDFLRRSRCKPLPARFLSICSWKLSASYCVEYGLW